MTSATLAHLIIDRDKLSRPNRVAFTFGTVALLHLVAAVLVFLAPAGGRAPLALGAVVAAYVAGLKHSYDWDHVSAIDNSTRKFVADGRDPASVGLAFSLGHSTVVTLATLAVLAGVRAAHGALTEGSTANTVLGIIGAAVSGVYLLVLGLYNASTAWRLRAAGNQARAQGHVHDMPSGGLVGRLVARPIQRVRRPRDIFVIGFLFGLGFDTATTIGLMVVALGASAAGVSPVALAGLPFAFAAGMTLCDSLNGLAMMHLYRNALADHARRHRFNLAITTVSAVSALFIAVLTLGALAHDLFGLDDPVTGFLAGVDLGDAGLLLVAVMFGTWGLFALAERRRR